jgi:hypothetical protein
MGTYVAGADQTAIEAAAVLSGVSPQVATNAFLGFPTVAWDAGVAPAVAADTTWAVRDAFRRVGIFAEKADLVLSKVATGIKAVATIPNVVGVQEVLAAQTLAAAGLRVGTKTYVVNAAAAGQITVQSPVAGASEVGKPVNLTISLGP